MPLTWNEAKNQWEGDGTDPLNAIEYNRYDELPNPTTVPLGQLALVIADPNEFLNGLHVALGGTPPTYWTKA